MLVALAVTVLGIGRFPRRARDFALLAISVGFIWFAFPQIGKTLFNRASGANYLYGAAIQLWFLVPLRLTTSGSTSGVTEAPTHSPGKLVRPGRGASAIWRPTLPSRTICSATTSRCSARPGW